MQLPPPQFFDIFGASAFLFLVIVSAWSLKTRRPFPQWGTVLVFAIGVFGFAVDAYFVTTTYLLP